MEIRFAPKEVYIRSTDQYGYVLAEFETLDGRDFYVIENKHGEPMIFDRRDIIELC